MPCGTACRSFDTFCRLPTFGQTASVQSGMSAASMPRYGDRLQQTASQSAPEPEQKISGNLSGSSREPGRPASRELGGEALASARGTKCKIGPSIREPGVIKVSHEIAS